MNFIQKLTENTREVPEVLSYKATRLIIGYIGILLPVALLIGGLQIELGNSFMMPSISHYYYTNLVTLFTGSLCAVGLFLISYRGYNLLDELSTKFAGLCAFGVAFFPTNYRPKMFTIYREGAVSPYPITHFTFAALFFIGLALISIFIFTKTKPVVGHVPTAEKRRRNGIFVITGILMILSVALIWVTMKFDLFPNYNLTFWLEMFALWCFGISWLTKGEVIYGDKK